MPEAVDAETEDTEDTAEGETEQTEGGVTVGWQ